jgi:hypothetical protein
VRPLAQHLHQSRTLEDRQQPEGVAAAGEDRFGIAQEPLALGVYREGRDFDPDPGQAAPDRLAVLLPVEKGERDEDQAPGLPQEVLEFGLDMVEVALPVVRGVADQEQPAVHTPPP